MKYITPKGTEVSFDPSISIGPTEYPLLWKFCNPNYDPKDEGLNSFGSTQSPEVKEIGALIKQTILWARNNPEEAAKVNDLSTPTDKK